MRSPVYQVWRTYQTRRLLWVLIALAAALPWLLVRKDSGMENVGSWVALGYFNRGPDPADLRELEAEGRLDEVQSLHLFDLQGQLLREAATWEVVEGRNIRMVEPEDTPDMLAFAEILQRMPNLRVLQTGPVLVRPTGIAGEEPQLLLPAGELPQVETLIVLSSAPGTELFGEGNRLPNLRTLDLSQGYLTGGMANLSGSTSLETLFLSQNTMVNDALLSEVAAIKSLETLVMTVPVGLAHEESTPNSLTAAGLDSLAELPNLKHLYLWTVGNNLPEGVHRALVDRLPAVQVHRRFYKPARMGQVFLLLVSMLLVGAALAIHMAQQFSGPPARLLPGFQRPHFVVPACVLGLMSAINVALLIHHGADAVGGMSVTLGVTGMAVFLVTWTLTDIRARTSSSFKRPWVWSALMLTPPMAIYFGGANCFVWIESLLLGDDMRLLAGFGLLGAVGLAGAVASLQHLRLRAAEGVAVSTWSRVGSQQQRWNSAWYAAAALQKETQHPEKRAPQLYRLSDRRLARRLAARPGLDRNSTRQTLWRAANLDSGVGLRGFVGMWLFVAIVAYVLSADWFPVILTGKVLVFGLLGQLGFVALFMSFITTTGVWWDRRRMLPWESLRPVGRREFRDDIVRCLLRDLLQSIAWAILPILLMGVYLLQSWDRPDGEPMIWPLISVACMLAGGSMLAAAGMLWIVILRQLWSAVVVCVAVLAIAGILPAAMEATRRVAMEEFPTGLAIVYAGYLGVTGGLLFQAGWRRWRNMELGHQPRHWWR